MKRFAVSCVLGLSALAVSPVSVANTINNWDEIAQGGGDAGPDLGSAQCVGDAPACQTSVLRDIGTITGSLAANPGDKADSFTFYWQGNGSGGPANLHIDVNFHDIEPWDQTGTLPTTPSVFTAILQNILGTEGDSQDNDPANIPNNPPNNWIYQFNGRSTVFPDNSGPNSTTLFPLNAFLSPGNYFLTLSQDVGGNNNYTVTFADPLYPATNPPPDGRVPEPGTFGLMGLGLVAAALHRRRRQIG